MKITQKPPMTKSQKFYTGFNIVTCILLVYFMSLCIKYHYNMYVWYLIIGICIVGYYLYINRMKKRIRNTFSLFTKELNINEDQLFIKDAQTQRKGNYMYAVYKQKEVVYSMYIGRERVRTFTNISMSFFLENEVTKQWEEIVTKISCFTNNLSQTNVLVNYEKEDSLPKYKFYLSFPKLITDETVLQVCHFFKQLTNSYHLYQPNYYLHFFDKLACNHLYIKYNNGEIAECIVFDEEGIGFIIDNDEVPEWYRLEGSSDDKEMFDVDFINKEIFERKREETQK